MNAETKLFVYSILNNLDELIKAFENNKEENFIDFIHIINLKFAKQFILEYAKLNGYEG